jgi:hypothetical protein
MMDAARPRELAFEQLKEFERESGLALLDDRTRSLPYGCGLLLPGEAIPRDGRLILTAFNRLPVSC